MLINYLVSGETGKPAIVGYANMVVVTMYYGTEFASIYVREYPEKKPAEGLEMPRNNMSMKLFLESDIDTIWKMMDLKFHSKQSLAKLREKLKDELMTMEL